MLNRLASLLLLLALAGCSMAHPPVTRAACREAAAARYTSCRATCGDGIFRHSCLGCDNRLAMDRIGCGNGYFLEDGNI
jgi:hypothetical protein